MELQFGCFLTDNCDKAGDSNSNICSFQLRVRYHGFLCCGSKIFSVVMINVPVLKYVAVPTFTVNGFGK